MVILSLLVWNRGGESKETKIWNAIKLKIVWFLCARVKEPTKSIKCIKQEVIEV